MQLEHQSKNDKGGFKHRLVPAGTKGLEEKYPWKDYTQPACFYTTKGTFIVVTNYYKGSSEFPDPRKLYRVTESDWNI